MSDLVDLKRAMQSPPDFAPRELDLSEIMRAGGRIRTRRRLAAGAAAALAVVVVLVGGSQLIGTKNNSGLGTSTAPAGGGPGREPVATSSTALSDATPGTATPTATPGTASPEPTRTALGAVIRTGLASKDGEWVFYAVAVDEPTLPDTRFGIMLAQRQPNGRLAASVMINETEGSDRSAGFHQGQASSLIGGQTTPTFGYYVGDVYRIATIVHGKTMNADLRAWSQDPSVKVFWFNPTKVPRNVPLTKVIAYDRQGRKLATGTDGFGVG